MKYLSLAVVMLTFYSTWALDCKLPCSMACDVSVKICDIVATDKPLCTKYNDTCKDSCSSICKCQDECNGDCTKVNGDCRKIFPPPFDLGCSVLQALCSTSLCSMKCSTETVGVISPELINIASTQSHVTLEVIQSILSNLQKSVNTSGLSNLTEVNGDLFKHFVNFFTNFTGAVKNPAGTLTGPFDFVRTLASFLTLPIDAMKNINSLITNAATISYNLGDLITKASNLLSTFSGGGLLSGLTSGSSGLLPNLNSSSSGLLPNLSGANNSLGSLGSIFQKLTNKP